MALTCRLGNEFRPMIIRAEGWFLCEGCGHNAMPLDPEFKCTCANCEQTEPSVPTSGTLQGNRKLLAP